MPNKSLCSQITAEVSKIKKNVLHELAFIFTEPPDIANSFLKIRLVCKKKNVTSFIKTHF